MTVPEAGTLASHSGPFFVCGLPVRSLAIAAAIRTTCGAVFYAVRCVVARNGLNRAGQPEEERGIVLSAGLHARLSSVTCSTERPSGRLAQSAEGRRIRKITTRGQRGTTKVSVFAAARRHHNRLRAFCARAWSLASLRTITCGRLEKRARRNSSRVNRSPNPCTCEASGPTDLFAHLPQYELPFHLALLHGVLVLSSGLGHFLGHVAVDLVDRNDAVAVGVRLAA